MGIKTSQHLGLDSLGLSNSDFQAYVPTDYRSFRKIMKNVEIKENHDVFIDYGSGMGRVPIMAAAYPFRKVIGVEISSRLNKIARENIDRVKNKLLCGNIEIVEADATTYSLPAEVTIIYLYNPFQGEALARVLEKIDASLAAAPRKVTLIYKHTEDFDAEIRKRPWLTKRAEFPGYWHGAYGDQLYVVCENV